MLNQTLTNLTTQSAKMALIMAMLDAGVPQYRGTHIRERTFNIRNHEGI